MRVRAPLHQVPGLFLLKNFQMGEKKKIFSFFHQIESRNAPLHFIVTQFVTFYSQFRWLHYFCQPYIVKFCSLCSQCRKFTVMRAGRKFIIMKNKMLFKPIKCDLRIVNYLYDSFGPMVRGKVCGFF